MTLTVLCVTLLARQANQTLSRPLGCFFSQVGVPSNSTVNGANLGGKAGSYRQRVAKPESIFGYLSSSTTHPSPPPPPPPPPMSISGQYKTRRQHKAKHNHRPGRPAWSGSRYKVWSVSSSSSRRSALKPPLFSDGFCGHPQLQAAAAAGLLSLSFQAGNAAGLVFLRNLHTDR